MESRAVKDGGQSRPTPSEIIAQSSHGPTMGRGRALFFNTVLDANRNYISIDEGFCATVGYTHDELIGAPYTLLDAGENSQEEIAAVWDFVEANGAFCGTNKFMRKDGKPVWVRFTLSQDEDAQGARIYRMWGADVSDLVARSKKRVRLLSQQEYARHINRAFAIRRMDASLRDMLASALGILFEIKWLGVLNKGGVFVYDKQREDLELVCSHGLGPQIENLCSRVAMGHCLCGRAALTKKLVHASCVDERHEIRFDGMGPHGHYNVPIMLGGDLLGVLVVYLEHGAAKEKDHELFLMEFAQALGVLMGFKKREEALIEAKQDAEAAMVEAQQAERAKSDFLASMSHEIRTPLNGVVGMLQALNMNSLSEEQSEYVDIALSSADNLLSLLDDVLDFSSLEHSAMKLDIAEVDLHETINRSVQAFLFMAKEKGLQLELNGLTGQPLIVRGDAMRVRQIITNLVSNAIKFTHEGAISVSARALGGAEAHGRVRKVEISVTDTGIGIPDDMHGRIFNRFTQVDVSESRVFDGAGLGLAICKKLAEAMDGEIGVESKPGQGARFWVRLPAV